MGKTSTASKRKYNEKAYDRINLVVPKGMKEQYAAAAKEKGYPSLNNYINTLLKNDNKEAPAD